MNKALPSLSLSIQWASLPPSIKKNHRECLPRHHLYRWIRRSLAAPAQITVRIVDEQEGKTLNADYRKKAYATNILTFVYASLPIIQADLILCAPIIEKEALEQKKHLAFHYAHLIVHGTLHAQGWEHEYDEQEAEKMEAKETEILKKLRFSNPYDSNP